MLLHFQVEISCSYSDSNPRSACCTKPYTAVTLIANCPIIKFLYSNYVVIVDCLIVCVAVEKAHAISDTTAKEQFVCFFLSQLHSPCILLLYPSRSILGISHIFPPSSYVLRISVKFPHMIFVYSSCFYCSDVFHMHESTNYIVWTTTILQFFFWTSPSLFLYTYNVYVMVLS